jgi:hypothetical protein
MNTDCMYFCIKTNLIWNYQKIKYLLQEVPLVLG